MKPVLTASVTPPEIKPSTKYAVRTFLVLVLLGGLALLGAASRSSAAPGWWWWLGGGMVFVGGGFVVEFVRYRLKYPTPEAREKHRQEVFAKWQTHRAVIDQGRAEEGEKVDRQRVAREASRYKAAVLRAGVDGTAVVTFIADVRYGTESEHLVYLELEVTVGEAAPYQVRTGEYLTVASSGAVAPGRQLDVKVDPADPLRVAVDWERSLRLKVSG